MKKTCNNNWSVETAKKIMSDILTYIQICLCTYKCTQQTKQWLKEKKKEKKKSQQNIHSEITAKDSGKWSSQKKKIIIIAN